MTLSFLGAELPAQMEKEAAADEEWRVQNHMTGLFGWAPWKYHRYTPRDRFYRENLRTEQNPVNSAIPVGLEVWLKVCKFFFRKQG